MNFLQLRGWVLLPVLAVMAGCRTAQLPNPNDPKQGPISAENLNRQLRVLNENLYARRGKRELTEERYISLLQKGADEIVSGVDLEGMDASEAWQYAEVLLTAKHWENAIKFLKIAVRHAELTKNEDRRVNDSLRLAHALAQTGKVPEAIQTARSTFNVRSQDAVPVLMGILYEIVPAARKKKGDKVQLAKLLEDAIPIHERATVDPNSEPGRNFLMARPTHIRKAWSVVIDLLQEANRPDLVEAAYRKLSK